MPRRTRGAAGHTGRTDAGNVRDLKVDRIGPVTIYKRGHSFSLYFREHGATRRRKVDGNLAVARATAARVAAALAEGQRAPIGHDRTTPRALVGVFLETAATVRDLAPRTCDRYRAALERFLEFCDDSGLASLDEVDGAAVEDFVRWLRGRTRTRNGAARGKRDRYKTGGIWFILSTCRAAFLWAARRRMLPPFAENPFQGVPIEALRDRDEDGGATRVFSPAQEAAFFAACDAWQRPIFEALATYGLRVGELTHLLVEDVDLDAGTISVRSKPELGWSVKTGRQRVLPLTPRMRELFGGLIGGRRAGFVFLNEEYATGHKAPAAAFGSPQAFRARLRRIVDDLTAGNPGATDQDRRRAITAFCRAMGQMPEKRIRAELMKRTRDIGCPEFTRAHDLRHLFSSRAQEAGVNPLLVQELLGHSSLEMTRRYTHLGLETKRTALSALDGAGGRGRAGGPGRPADDEASGSP